MSHESRTRWHAILSHSDLGRKAGDGENRCVLEQPTSRINGAGTTPATDNDSDLPAPRREYWSAYGPYDLSEVIETILVEYEVLAEQRRAEAPFRLRCDGKHH